MYLPPTKRVPLADPKVEMHTASGISHAMAPRVRPPNVCATARPPRRDGWRNARNVSNNKQQSERQQQQQQQQQQREIRNRREHHCHHDGTVRKRRPRRRKKRSTAGRDGNGKPSGAEEGAVERAEHGHDDAERHQESRRTQHPLAPQLGRGQGTASAMALARGNLRPDRANSARPHPTNRPIYRFSIVSRLRFGLRVHLEPVIFGRKEKKEKTTLPDWLPVLA